MMRFKKIALAVILNTAVVLLEVWFAHTAGSLSLLSDALHNLQDVLALVISLTALYLSRRKPTETSTYGYARAEAFGAFLGALMLVFSVLYVGYEAVKSLITGGSDVIGVYVLGVGGVAFVVNGISAYVLHGDRNLSVRSAYLHLLGDAAFSLAVLVGGMVMMITGWSAVDSILTLLFAPFLLKDGLSLLLKSARVLMEFAPEGYSSHVVSDLISGVEGVKDVHDVHVWALSSDEPFVSAHVVLRGEVDAEELSRVLADVKDRLRGIGVKHITLQIEPEDYECENTCERTYPDGKAH